MNIKIAILIGIMGVMLGGILRDVEEGGGMTAHFLQRLRKESHHTISLLPKPVVHPSVQLHRAAGDGVLHTEYPIRHIPNWGAMRSKTLWNRPFREIDSSEFVPVPEYDLSVLTFQMQALDPEKPGDIPLITTKLFYSTRFFSAYDLDAGEFTGPHAGVDLKLPQGMPVGAIADGLVHVAHQDDRLGLYVILEHTHSTGDILFSIYGHLDTATVEQGDRVRAGDPIGTVGTSGYTSGAHLHLQIDRPVQSGGTHTPFITYTTPFSPSQVDLWTVHPIHFMESGEL